MKEKMRKVANSLLSNQLDGVGVVEIILILVILIGLVLLFRTQITDIITKAFASITRDANIIVN
ncbi:MAG TPA: hypothetical protein GX731_04295 [Clostridiales bacterium]|nr:hypothetical protein [Clostridiales bacterium]